MVTSWVESHFIWLFNIVSTCSCSSWSFHHLSFIWLTLLLNFKCWFSHHFLWEAIPYPQIKWSGLSMSFTRNQNVCYVLLNNLTSSLDYQLHKGWGFVHFVLITLRLAEHLAHRICLINIPWSNKCFIVHDRLSDMHNSCQTQSNSQVLSHEVSYTPWPQKVRTDRLWLGSPERQEVSVYGNGSKSFPQQLHCQE